MAAVYAEHMIGDHWWVVVNNIRFHESGADFNEYKSGAQTRSLPQQSPASRAAATRSVKEDLRLTSRGS